MKPELRPGAAGLKGSDAHPPDRRRQGQRRRATGAATAGAVRSTGPHALLIVAGTDETPGTGGSVERSGIERDRASGAKRPVILRARTTAVVRFSARDEIFCLVSSETRKGR